MDSPGAPTILDSRISYILNGTGVIKLSSTMYNWPLYLCKHLFSVILIVWAT